MKLYSSTTSPYVRKVLIAAMELGLDGRLDQELIATSPIDQNAALRADSPVARLPTLMLDDGSALYDSRVIVEYLDHLAGGGGVIPVAWSARLTALRRQALADGMLDTLVSVRYELALRPESLRWPDLVARQFERVERGLAFAELEAADLSRGALFLGDIAIACLLGYLDFRFGEFGWRNRAPALSEWYSEVSKQPSLLATMPK